MDDASPDVFDEYLACVSRGERPDPASFAAERGITDESVVAALRRLLDCAPESLEPPANPDLPRARIGEFRLLRKLGAGGMGVVYLARQESLRRDVAVKVLPPEHATSVTLAARLRREAEILAKLEHPSIVRVYASGDEDGYCYIAMEYVVGEGLDAVLARGGVDPRDALRWCAEIAEALAVAHDAGVLHRDVKPSNVRIDASGRARLLDFGLARDASAMTLTTTSSFQGSLLYAAPEQLQSRRAEFGPATDVYALGVVLYEALSGEPPFLAETPEQLIAAVLTRDPLPLRRVVPTIARDVETVVAKAIERSPARRYADARAFAADLRAILELRPISARPPGLVERARRVLRARPAVRVAAIGAGVLALGLSLEFARSRIEERRERRAIDDRFALATAAYERGAYDEALGALAALEERAPGDPRAPALRERVERERARRAARELVAGARRRIGEHRALASSARDSRAEVGAIEARAKSAVLSAEEEREFLASLSRKRSAAGDLAALRVSIVDDLARAEALAPDDSAPRVALVDFLVEEWRDATARGDDRGARELAARIERDDREGRYVAEIAGLGDLSIASEPPGAELHLFRYELDSDRRDGGEPRLVPVPVGGPRFVEPHAFVLRVVEDAEDLRTGDLIVALDGLPCEDRVHAGADAGGVRRGDRLISIDGRPLAGSFGRDIAVQRKRPCDAVFSRGDERIAVRFEPGMPEPPLLDAAEYAALGGVPATVIGADGPRAVELPRGIRVRRTMNPLPLIADDAAGVTPFPSTPFPPGSYLAVVRLEGFEDQRVPFVVGRGARVDLHVALDAIGTTPAGFVRIRGGETRLGGDGDAEVPRDLELETLEPYFLMEREVTFEEYVEFLNDPDIRAAIERAPDPIYFPRDDVNAHQGGYLVRVDGEFAVPTRFAGLPVCAISRDDATAYARWFDARAEARGDPLAYGLPSDPQWEAAGRGADARLYPFGNVFVPFWVKSRFANSPGHLEAPMRFVRDESPYGVFDLCGSVMEFVSTGGVGANEARTKAGAFIIPDAPVFRLDGHHALDPRSCEAMNGFRLAAWPRKTGD